MKKWRLLASAKVPGGAQTLTLHQSGEEFSIKIDGNLLMNNLAHHSEDALAEIVLRRIAHARRPSVLVGGLGMGFTLAAALAKTGPQAQMFVSELVPEVVEWNRGPLSHLAGHPLRDPRVTVLREDIAVLLKTQREAYDAILQDVDNGPEGLTLKANDWLYSDDGLQAAMRCLKPKGVIAFWSVRTNRPFLKRLRKAGFDAEEIPVRGRDAHRGAHHIIWTAAKRG